MALTSALVPNICSFVIAMSLFALAWTVEWVTDSQFEPWYYSHPAVGDPIGDGLNGDRTAEFITALGFDAGGANRRIGNLQHKIGI
jgi:hypothetical protein